jgi:hypothetical protein
MAQNLLCWATIPHILQTKFKKVKHATPRNKWSVCWSSSSITYLSPLGEKRGTILTHWYADDLLKQCPPKGDKYVIDEELQHTDHLFLGVACNACPSRAPEFTSGFFGGVRVAHLFSFVLSYYVSLCSEFRVMMWLQVWPLRFTNLQAFEETPTHMSIKINRLEEGHNSYPLVCRRPAETVSPQRRQICYQWGTPAYQVYWWRFIYQ